MNPNPQVSSSIHFSLTYVLYIKEKGLVGWPHIYMYVYIAYVKLSYVRIKIFSIYFTFSIKSYY